jgi:4'-phosphopantetheinyl transferase
MWNASAHWEPLIRDYVDVWRVPVPLPTGGIREAAAILTPQELVKMQSFAREEDRHRFLCARSALRWTLSRYLGIGPRDIRFDACQNGKPFLANLQAELPALEFNLTHSGAWALIAVSDKPVGIDVEGIRIGFDWLKIAKDYLPPGGAEEILALPPAQRPQAFFQAWTRLEAYLKGLGTGISKGADEYIKYVNTFITNIFPDDSLRKGWQVRNLDLDADHASALAWMDSGAHIRQWAYDWRELRVTHESPLR